MTAAVSTGVLSHLDTVRAGRRIAVLINLRAEPAAMATAKGCNGALLLYFPQVETLVNAYPLCLFPKETNTLASLHQKILLSTSLMQDTPCILTSYFEVRSTSYSVLLRVYAKVKSETLRILEMEAGELESGIICFCFVPHESFRSHVLLQFSGLNPCWCCF